MAKAAALYLIWTMVMLRPILMRAGDAIAMDPGDPVLNAAILHWNAITIPLTERWWNFPSFAPSEGTTAFTEHLVGLWPFASPVVWLTGNPLLAYNTTFLLSFPLAAVAMFALARSLTASVAGALLAGIAFAFNPYRGGQFSHLQMLMTFGMPAALLGLHAYVGNRRRSGIGLFVLGWLFTALSNGYFLLFFGLYIACWLLWFGTTRDTWRRSAVAVGVWAAASLTLLPFALRYMQVHERYGFVRPIDEIRNFSADISGIFTTPANAPVAAALVPSAFSEGALFPGFAVLLLALAGAIRGTSRAETRRPWRRLSQAALVATACFVAAAIVALVADLHAPLPWGTLSIASPHKPLTGALVCIAAWVLARPGVRGTIAARPSALFYAVMAAVAWTLSLGPEARLGQEQIVYAPPYSWLVTLPGFENLRAPARFWMLGTMSLAVLIAYAFRSRGPRTRIAAVLAALALLGEGWSIARASPVSYVERPVPPASDGVVLSLPLGDVIADANAQLRSVVNGHRTVNGYSGYEPAHYAPLRSGLDARDAGVVNEMRRYSDLYVDVGASDQTWRTWLSEAFPDLELVSESRERALYRLAQRLDDVRGPGHPVPFGVSEASCNREAAPLAADGLYTTRWECGPGVPGQSFVVDLRSARAVAGIGHAIGAHVRDAPNVLRVEASGDRTTWRTVWRGPTAAQALRAGLEDPRRVELVLAWPSTQARYLRLTQIGPRTMWYWSIAELRVFAPRERRRNGR